MPNRRGRRDACGRRMYLIVAGADGGMHTRSTDGGMHAEDVPDSSWRDACPRAHHFNRLYKWVMVDGMHLSITAN
jgi:hypothetical protein